MAEAAKDLEGEDCLDGFDVDSVGAKVVHGPLHIAMLGAADIVEGVDLELCCDVFIES